MMEVPMWIVVWNGTLIFVLLLSVVVMVVLFVRRNRRMDRLLGRLSLSSSLTMFEAARHAVVSSGGEGTKKETGCHLLAGAISLLSIDTPKDVFLSLCGESYDQARVKGDFVKMSAAPPVVSAEECGAWKAGP